MRHPQDILAQEPSLSDAGATAGGRLDSDANNFLRLGRSIRDDFVNGKLDIDEFFLFVWLQLEANPRNGQVKISYAGLAQDFRGGYAINKITKLIHSLKRKGYLDFPKRQGKRGSFIVSLDNYPLSNKTFTKLNGDKTRKKDAARHESGVDFEPINGHQENNAVEVKTEVQSREQKFTGSVKSAEQLLFDSPFWSLGRSPNNDNENQRENQKSLHRHFEKEDDFASTNDERNELRCREIAEALRERDPRFTISVWQKYGIDVVEEAYAITCNKEEKEGLENPGAFFNSVVQNLGQQKLDGLQNPPHLWEPAN